MSATCPACGAEQQQSLLCHSCTTLIERDLRSVPALSEDLDIALSRQARIGTGGKAGKGGAHTRWPINTGAAAAAWDLQQVLTIWARELSKTPVATTVHASHVLLLHINEIRRHPDVDHMVEKITQAITKARHTIDRPQDRVFVGPCMYADPDTDITCLADIYARPAASHAACKVCGITHDVAERRAWLLEQASDRLFTVREASQMLGDVGGIRVTESRIRGYIHRQRLAYHPIGDGKGIRLGDLLTVVIDDGERKSA